jgi:uncharacterized protein YjcR
MATERKDKFYGSKEEVRKVIDNATYSLRVTRKTLADKLGISNRTLHGWITDGWIPWKHYDRLIEFTQKQDSVTPNEKTKPSQSNSKLKDFSTGELMEELVSRGIKVSFG